MNEAAKNPFEPFFDEIRRIVRDEIKAANNGNGHSLLTAEQLAKALQVNKATVYEWVKSKTIPYYQAGRFVRFNLGEVLESQRSRNRHKTKHYAYSLNVYDRKGLQEAAAKERLQPSATGPRVWR